MTTKHGKYVFLLIFGALMTLSAACNNSADKIEAEPILQATNTVEQSPVMEPTNPAPAPTQETMPALFPGDVPEPERTLNDSDSSLRAYEHRVLSGDWFLDNLYERPFTSKDMIYQPDLDIYSVDFAQDDDFFYFTINLNGLNPDNNRLNGMYGIEFDRTLTGRGDLLVWAENFQPEWSMENVYIYNDEDRDVGGENPMIANEGFIGTGYEVQVQMEGDRIAYTRVLPDVPDAIQLAISRSLIDDAEVFMWNAWADNVIKDETKFDYNDTMGPSAAGSPIKTNEDYPLRDLFNLDNTCRLPYGFAQMGADYRGLCITMPPAPEPVIGGAPGQTCVTTCTPGNPRLQIPPSCTTVCN